MVSLASASSPAPTGSTPSSRSVGDERGGGRRTRAWVESIDDPIVASRTERTILTAAPAGRRVTRRPDRDLLDPLIAAPADQVTVAGDVLARAGMGARVEPCFAVRDVLAALLRPIESRIRPDPVVDLPDDLIDVDDDNVTEPVAAAAAAHLAAVRGHGARSPGCRCGCAGQAPAGGRGSRGAPRPAASRSDRSLAASWSTPTYVALLVTSLGWREPLAVTTRASGRAWCRPGGRAGTCGGGRGSR
jgi:hypothetical protein